MAWSVNEDAGISCRATGKQVLADLKQWIAGQQKTTTDLTLKAHYQLAIERIAAPEKAKPTQHMVMPPGAPIGCEERSISE